MEQRCRGRDVVVGGGGRELRRNECVPGREFQFRKTKNLTRPSVGRPARTPGQVHAPPGCALETAATINVTYVSPRFKRTDFFKTGRKVLVPHGKKKVAEGTGGQVSRLFRALRSKARGDSKAIPCPRDVAGTNCLSPLTPLRSTPRLQPPLGVLLPPARERRGGAERATPGRAP